MSNLFFIHTPFQLLIAQKLIKQQGLTHNIMLYGYVGRNDCFKQIFELMKVVEMWDFEYFFPKIAEWANIDIHHPISSSIRIYNSYKRISQHIKVHQVDNIYLGDINNLSYKFSSVVLHQKGMKINFFEEGTSHYTFQKHRLTQLGIFWSSLLKYIYDGLYYRPFFGIKFAHWRFIEDLPFNKMQIDARFSVLPRYHECFDHLLSNTLVVSQNAIDYIKLECMDVDTSKYVLFLEQPIYECVLKSEDAFIETINTYINSLEPRTKVIIKFHPREKSEIRENIENLFKTNLVEYMVIGNKVNLPIELYLQVMRFDHIVNFFSSTAIYNGYLFEKTPIVYLIENFYEICTRRNLEKTKGFEGLMQYYKNETKNV